MSRSRRVLRALVGAVAVLALALGLAWWRGGPEEGAAESVASPPPAPAAAPAASAAGSSAEPPPLPPREALPEPIRRYLAANAYPATSGRLTGAHEDLLRPNRRHERRRPVPDSLSDDPSAVVSYLFSADRFFYSGDETVEAFLQVWRGAEPVAPRILSARAVAEGRDGPSKDARTLAFVWQGDRLVADLPLTRFPEHHGPILLTVRFEHEPGRSHEDSIRIFNTPVRRIPARFTGRLRDSLREGHLLVEVELRVEAAGFYRLDANLRDAGGAPVAFATFKGELERGTRFVPLEVWGRVLRDAGIPGPYTVSEVRGYRFLEGSYPDRELIPDAALRHVTGSHALADLSDEPFTSEHQETMVRLMLEDLERGISLDVPGLPAPGEAPGSRPPDDDAEVRLLDTGDR